MVSHFEKCWKLVDEKLAGGNARLDFTYSLDGKVGVLVRVLSVKGRKPPLVLATYCPFCGEKLDLR